MVWRGVEGGVVLEVAAVVVRLVVVVLTGVLTAAVQVVVVVLVVGVRRGQGVVVGVVGLANPPAA